MNKFKALTFIFLISTIVFITLWVNANNELKQYQNSDRIYLKTENNRCDIYYWKKNDKIAFKGCDKYGDGFYESSADYNFYGELMALYNDYNHDGLFEIVKYYNQDEKLVAIYEDTDFDGFDDKKTIITDSIKSIYIDEDRNRIYDENEKINN